MAAMFAFSWLGYLRPVSVLGKWAAKNGFGLLKYRQLWFSVGAFDWTETSRLQTVFLVAVRDLQGSDKSGWVRVGSWWWGALFGDKADVVWA